MIQLPLQRKFQQKYLWKLFVNIYYNGYMTINGKTAAIPEVYTFNDVVDEACGKLMDKQIKYSIRRIVEMEESLDNMERELDDFLGKSDFHKNEIS